MKEEIVASRSKTAFLFLVLIIFTCTGLFLPGEQDTMMQWVTIFFGACALTSVVMLARPRRLSLDEIGFSVSGGLLRSAHKTAWQDVSEFFVLSLRPGTSFVGYRFSPEFAEKHPVSKFGRNLAGADGLLHGPWPGSDTKLATKLNACRQIALANAAM